MILTRKLILPALIVFAVLLVGIFAYTFNSLHETYHEAEEGDLVSYSGAFVAELENQKGVALAVASAAAGNPSIQQAFAERDRQKLVALTLPSFEMLKGYKITQYQYHLPNGARFLSLNDLNNQEEGGFLSVVDLANTEQKPVAGSESENGKLGIRAAVPIYYQGNHIGTVEIGIGFNDALLIGLKEKYGGEWNILLSQEVLAGASPQQIVGVTTPIPSLVLYATTQDNPLFNDENSYARALNGETAITHPSIDGRDYAILTSPLYDFSGKSVGALDIVYDHTHISSAENKRLLFVGLVSVLALVLGSLGLVAFTSRTLQPIRSLTTAAATITEGNFTGFVELKPSADEIGTLTTAFTRMTMQLRNLITDLENRVAERTRELERQTLRLRAAAEIARDATSAGDLDDLLNRSARLIQDRFSYYHTGIFLLDNTNEYAVLRASPSEAGQAMLANNHRLRVGEVGIVGYVASTGKPRIALDTGKDATYFDNPLLPNTRSEMALPLTADNVVIGVLDVQSEEPQAFSQDDVEIMQVMADQLASAFEKARLLSELQDNVSELERTNQQFTKEGWKEIGTQKGLVGYHFDKTRLESTTLIPELARSALETGTVTYSNHIDKKTRDLRTAAVPVKLRGQTIGVVNIQFKGDLIPEETVRLIESASDRLAVALENARLVQDSQRRASLEYTIGQMSNKIGSASEIDTVLKFTAQELGKLLSDTQVTVQLINPEEETTEGAPE